MRIACSAASRSGAARVVRDGDRERPPASRALQKFDRIGRRAAGRQSDHDVARGDGEMGERPARRAAVVLRAFRARAKRPLAARDREHDSFFRPIEGRRKLGPVLHPDAARRSGAGVNEASAVGEPHGRGLARLYDGWQGGAHRGHRRKLPFEHRVDGLETRPGVEILETGTAIFGAHLFAPGTPGSGRLPKLSGRRRSRTASKKTLNENGAEFVTARSGCKKIHAPPDRSGCRQRNYPLPDRGGGFHRAEVFDPVP